MHCLQEEYVDSQCALFWLLNHMKLNKNTFLSKVLVKACFDL